jgi:hypothetical protein
MSFDQAARQASALEKRLTRFLKVMADKAGATGPLRSTFESLLRQHEKEQATLTQTITDLERLQQTPPTFTPSTRPKKAPPPGGVPIFMWRLRAPR